MKKVFKQLILINFFFFILFSASINFTQAKNTTSNTLNKGENTEITTNLMKGKVLLENEKFDFKKNDSLISYNSNLFWYFFLFLALVFFIIGFYFHIFLLKTVNKKNSFYLISAKTIETLENLEIDSISNDELDKLNALSNTNFTRNELLKKLNQLKFSKEGRNLVMLHSKKSKKDNKNENLLNINNNVKNCSDELFNSKQNYKSLSVNPIRHEKKKFEEKNNNTKIDLPEKVSDEITNIKTIDLIKTKYFIAEAMVTAGPRKNFITEVKEGDVDLGEDVVGFIIINNIIYFWILDGTSDSDKLFLKGKTEYFSSRFLSQSISWNIHKVLNIYNNDINSSLLLEKAIDFTYKEWEDRFNSLDIDENEKIKKIAQEKNRLQCSTTILVGSLNLEGDLDVSQVGDSKIITNIDLNNNSKSRLFSIIEFDKVTGKINLIFNEFEDLKVQKIQEKGIRDIIIMTDGISLNTENWLKLLIKNNKFNITSESFRQTLTTLNQKTNDDKTICFIQIKS